MKILFTILLIIVGSASYAQLNSTDTAQRFSKANTWWAPTRFLVTDPSLSLRNIIFKPAQYAAASLPTGTTGGLIWDTDSLRFRYYNGSQWIILTTDGGGAVAGVATYNGRSGTVTGIAADVSGVGGWLNGGGSVGGNTFGAATSIGNTDNFAFNIFTNNVNRIGVAAGGNVSIGGQVLVGKTGTNAYIGLNRTSDGVEVGQIKVATHPIFNTETGTMFFQYANTTKMQVGILGVTLGGPATPTANAHFIAGNTGVRQTFWEDGNRLGTKVAGVLQRTADTLFWGISGPAEVRVVVSDTTILVGQIPFGNAGKRLATDPNLFWDNTGKELRVGGASDQGAFALQNTGGLYQNGQVSLRGTELSGATFKFLVKGTDSVIRQIDPANLPVLDTLRFIAPLKVRSGTNVDTVYLDTAGVTNGQVLTFNAGVWAAATPSGGATTIYNGDGTATNRNVTVSGFLNFTGGEVKIGSTTDRGAYPFQNTGDIFQAGGLVQAKSDATYPYSTYVGINASNYWQLGFNKGGATTPTIIIDTNNNVQIGGSVSTNIPLYSTGNTMYVSGGLAIDRGLYTNYAVVTSNTTITNGTSYHTILIDATGGNITVTLPTVASTSNGSGGTGSVGIEYVFKRIDNSVNVVTILAQGSDLIDGAGSILLATQFLTRKLQSCASNRWMIL